MLKEEAREILEGVRRGKIRYTINAIKRAVPGPAEQRDAWYELGNEDFLRSVREANPNFPHGDDLLIATRIWYSGQAGFAGWESWPDAWDIGIDDPVVMTQRWWGWLHEQWWTFGISRLVAVRNPGPPRIVEESSGAVRIVTPARFFIEKGYATDDESGVRPDIERFMQDVGRRASWI